tara:strand:- start:435 stop:542 length:108 start_codon:yes stop_codon:yes gene_type:complete
MHIANVLNDKELKEKSVVKYYLTTATYLIAETLWG